jgi:hypothetical protein
MRELQFSITQTKLIWNGDITISVNIHFTTYSRKSSFSNRYKIRNDERDDQGQYESRMKQLDQTKMTGYKMPKKN